jgi:predicted RNA-binding Zn ribbon-like protein
MDPLFLGSHPGMDFLNTTLSPGGTPIELIGDGEAFAAWLEAAALLGGVTAAELRKRFPRSELDAAAAQAREFRQWAGEWIERWRARPGRHDAGNLRRLNELLARAKLYREALPGAGGAFELAERCRVESAEDLVSLVVAPVAQLLAQERPELVKRCAGHACTLWFLDRTKAHGRRFCSAAACGNRAKVAAFRERQRDQG